MKRMALLWLGLTAIALGGVSSSGADFTGGSQSPGNTFTAAADFNTVAVSLTDPGTALRGTVALQATASSERGIDRVRFQSSPAGAGTWTDICNDSSAPYTCNWDTAGVADGLRDVRALAVDQAGYQRASTVSNRRIDNTQPTASLNDPGVLQGSEMLTATASDAGSGLATLAIAYRPAGGPSWTTLCTGATSPRSCALNTTTLPDGSYELRARATDAAGNQRDTTLTRTVDNNAPTVSVVPPPAVVRGTIAISMNAADGAGTGVAGVTLQMRPASGTWAPVCPADTAAPYECNVTTTSFADGVYEARAIATDGAGFSTTSTAVTNIRIDNTAPTVTLADPGTRLSGSPALSGTANDTGSGVAAWIAQYSPAGANSWTNACSDTAAPFGSCTWATTGVPDGRYDLRAVARDTAGNEATSALRTNRVVDNDATPTGTDIQTTNGGATPGRAEAGDTITFTYSEPIDPGTINSSFTGSSMAIQVRLASGIFTNDRLEFTSGSGQINLVNSANGLSLDGTDYAWLGTAVFNATMVQSGNQIIITLGAPSSGANWLLTQTENTTMTWTPSANARDWAGNAVGTGTVTEAGPGDVEF